MKNYYFWIIVLVLLFVGYSEVNSMNEKAEKQINNTSQKTEMAVFAGGCFWCTESDFEKAEGVIEVISGYTGGNVVNPSYEEVSRGGTGHVEAVRVIYDPAKVTYEKLLDIFWRHVDPTDGGGQFVDRGSQYRSVIFYGNEEERRLAEASKKRLAETGPFDKPIVTDILALASFYPAEEYHQNYYKKNPIRYSWYRHGSGRDRFLEKTWAGRASDMMTDIKHQGAEEELSDGKGMMNETQTPLGKNSAMKTGDLYSRPDDQTLRSRLTDMQYQVTRRNGTEPPFKNEYWDNHEAGIYVDIVSGEPLFSSTDKFDSGTGWPSFSRTLEAGNIVEKSDRSFFMERTEVRSKHADSHLGHLFNDGPKTTGLRYCINSAALRFIPAADLERAGYGKYRKLFE